MTTARAAWKAAGERLVEAARELVNLFPSYAPALYAHKPTLVNGLRTFAVTPGWALLYDPAKLAEWSAKRTMVTLPTGEQAEVSLATGVLLHEVKHSLRDHSGRYREYMNGGVPATAKQWNIAGDGEINHDLPLPLPAGTILPPKGMDGATVEEIMDALGRGERPQCTRPEKQAEADANEEQAPQGPTVDADPVEDDEDEGPEEDEDDDTEGEDEGGNEAESQPGEGSDAEDDDPDEDDSEGEGSEGGNGSDMEDDTDPEDGEAGDDGEPGGEGEPAEGGVPADEVNIEDVPDLPCFDEEEPEPVDKKREREIERARRATAENILDDEDASEEEAEWAEGVAGSGGDEGEGDGEGFTIEQTEEQWERHLRVAVQGASGFGAEDWNVRRLDQNYPDFAVPTLDAPVFTVGLVLDVSGSMDSFLAGTAGHAVAVLRALGEATVNLYCTSTVTVEYRGVTRIEGIDLTKGGTRGTDLRVGTRKAWADGNDMVVVLSDCETAWDRDDPGKPMVVGAVGPAQGYMDRDSYRPPAWAQVVPLADTKGGQ